MGLGVLRVQTDHFAPVAGGLGVLFRRPESASPVEVGVRVLGIEPNRGAIVGERLVVILPGLEDVGPAEVSARPLGIEANGFAIVGDRLVIILQALVGNTPVQIGQRVGRVEAHGFGEIADRLVGLAQAVVDNAPVAEPGGLLRVGRHAPNNQAAQSERSVVRFVDLGRGAKRVVVVPERLVQLAFFLPGAAAVGVSKRVAGVNAKPVGEMGNRVLEQDGAVLGKPALGAGLADAQPGTR